MNPQPKIKRWEIKKWRDAAKGQPCTMNLPCCNHNPETTVLAHRNGAGMSTKASDHDAADMCSACHDAFDGRMGTLLEDGLCLRDYFDRARFKTIINRLERGILK
jgi:hypothetical protein